MFLGPALPLGELGNCLRPSSERRLKISEKKDKEGEKKIVSDKLQKIDTSF